jgi:RNA polymerase sigma-70 factor, ECF subfamily
MLISFSLSLFRRVFALPSPRVRRGDPSGTAEALRGRLASIVHDHVDAIYRTARRLGVSDTDMEDLVLLRRLDDIEPGKERAFVVAVAAGVAANRRRHERRHPEDASDMLDELGTSEGLGVLGQGSTHGSGNGEQSVERARRFALLQKGLASMTEAQRAAFVLFELEQLTAREIAEELGVSTFTVVSRVRRAREVLSRTLRAEYRILRDEADHDESEGK